MHHNLSSSITTAGSTPAPVAFGVLVNQQGSSLVPAIPCGVRTPSLFHATASSTLAQTTTPKTEPELLAILRSDKPEAEKALACKNLSVYGSSAAVPELAKLLANERLN